MDNWIAQAETPVIVKDEYRFMLEEFRRGEDKMVFLHLDVFVWTPSVFKEILRNWKLFRECVSCPLFVHAGNPHAGDIQKWEKFVTRLGFRYLQDAVCENGAQRRLFVHYKENKNNDLFDEQHQHQPERLDQRYVEHEPVVGAVAVHHAGVQSSAEC